MKKYFYSLCIITILSSITTFGQLEICQRQIIPEEHKLYKTLLCLVEDIKASKTNLIDFKKQQYLSKHNKKIDQPATPNNVLPPLFANRILYDFEIIPIEASINSDSAEVKYKMMIVTIDGNFTENLSLQFVKEYNVWILNDDFNSDRFLTFLDGSYYPLPADSLTTLNIRENTKTLIPYRFTSDPEIWEINQKITSEYLDRWLFAKDSHLDMDLHWYAGFDWPSGNAVFYLDPYWHRILYSKYNSSDIKSLDIEFYPGAEYPSEPWGITTDDEGKIYVSDRRNNCIVKLFYDIDSNSIDFLRKMNIEGLDRPMDVAYSSGLDPKTLDDDYLLIPNKYARNIIRTDLDGNILNSITQFKAEGTYHNFRSPSRIAQVPGTNIIAVIDDVLNYFLVGRIEGPNTLLCYNVIRFSGSQHPKDIGVNCYGDIMIPDNLNQIHKFTSAGEYLCTYISNTFRFPLRYSRINDLNYYIFDQVSADRWSPDNGIKRFIPGSDAFWLNHTRQINEHKFAYYLSDFSKVRIEIIDSADQIIKTINYNYLCGGQHHEILSLDDIPIGDYIFRVYNRPLYDEVYGDYQQGWRFSEIKFTCR